MDSLFGIYVEGGEYSDSWWQQLFVVSSEAEAIAVCDAANLIIKEAEEARRDFDSKNRCNLQQMPHFLHERLERKLVKEGLKPELERKLAENQAVREANALLCEAHRAKLDAFEAPFLERMKNLFPTLPPSLYGERYSYSELPWLSDIRIPTKE